MNFHNKHNKAFLYVFFFFFFPFPAAMRKESHSGLLKPPTSSPAPLVQSSLIKAYAFLCYRRVHLQTTIRQASALPLCRRAINPANVICGCDPLEKLSRSVSTASGVLPVANPTTPSTDESRPIGMGIVWMAADIMLTKVSVPLPCISNQTAALRVTLHLVFHLLQCPRALRRLPALQLFSLNLLET